MNYEFYADVFFLTNAYLDFLAVYAVGEVLQRKRRKLRYLVCCAISSLIGCILFLTMRDYDLYLLCIHFIVNPGMLLLCFFPVEKKIYIKAFGLMYFVILLLGGSVEWLYITICNRQYYELCLLLTGIPVIVFLYILRQKRENVHCFCQVLIVHKDKRIALRALYDTGNRLIDPYVKEPVHIVPKNVYEALGGKETFLVRLVPFSSVGCKSGMLEAFTVETLILEWENNRIELHSAVLAAANEELFENRAYQMILNSSVGERIGRKEEKICT